MGSAESIGNNIRITSMTGLGETNALQRTAGDKGKPEPDIFTDFVVEDLAELNKLVGLKQSGKVAISTLTP